MNFLKNILGNKNASPPTQSTLPAKEKKILIVEDDKSLREFYAELLSSEGFIVTTAQNGQEGLIAVQSQQPDLVLLDLMMPIMDGKTMLHQMREIPDFKKTPVIVLTNAGDADSMRQTQFFDNANSFLIKVNITPDEIVNKVKSLI